MRVLYIHQYFSTRGGATGTRSYEFARALVARGHQVTILCGTAEVANSGLRALAGESGERVRRGSIDGIDVVEVSLRYSNSLGLVRRAIAFLRFALHAMRVALREPCDIVFATSTPLTVAIPALCARWVRRKPFVFEVRDVWPELPVAMGVLKNKWVIRLLELLEHRAYRDAHGLVALAPGIGAAIERHGIPSSRIALIPNACDLDLFHPVPAKQKDRIPGHRGSPFVAAFCGAHGKANGLEAVLDAARCLIDQGEREIELLFIGTGSEKEALIRRARDEGLDNCRFLDLQPKTQLAGWLPHVDVGLMILANVPAFYYGTSPNKFFDYIAAGLPVVVNYPGWLATLIEQHECGMVVPPGDPRAFAQALRELKENPTRVREMGIHSRTLAEQEFSRESLASRFVAFLEQTTTAVKGGKQKL